MSLVDYFSRRIADRLHINREDVTDIYLHETLDRRKKKLHHLGIAFMGGHVVSKFLKHVSEDERELLYKRNEEFLRRFDKQASGE